MWTYLFGVTIQPTIVGVGLVCLFLLSPPYYPQTALTLIGVAQSQPQGGTGLPFTCFLWPQLVSPEDVL